MKCFRIISLVLTIAIPLAGCTTTRVDNVVRFPIEHETPRAKSVQEAGVYKVRWTEESTKDAKPIKGTARLLQEGTKVGFEPQADGTIVAFAGDDRIRIDHLPDDAKLLVWQKREKVPTKFAIGTGEFVRGVGTVALWMVIGVGYGIALYIDSLTSDSNDCH
jgi:hypothetical protein